VRAVSLELQLTEILVSLGAPPIAAADNALYRRLIGEPALPASVADLGPIQQPNLEFLQLLAPDLIVTPAWEASANRSALGRVAPVEIIGDLDPRPPLDRLEAIARRLATLVKRESEVEALIATANAAFDRAQGTVSSQPTVLCRFFEDGRHLAVFASKSVVGAVAERIGVANAWAGKQSAFGTTVASIEDLAAMPDARVVHFHRGAETERALRRLETSPLWRALPMVRRGEVIATPVVHPNGGLASATRLAGQLRSTLGRNA
ncbi:MAG: ABC transporter substrate-binding protein, partial [Hansschlegelia sp.]